MIDGTRNERRELTLLGQGPEAWVKPESADPLVKRGMEASPAEPLSTGHRPDSVVSARFFQEGDRQEALGRDLSLSSEAAQSPAPVKFSSFDRVPRRRGPLVLTTVVLAIAVLAGLGADGIRRRSAHAWLAAHAGPRAAGVWRKAQADLVNLKARVVTMRDTETPGTAEAQATTIAPVAPSEPAVASVAPAASQSISASLPLDATQLAANIGDPMPLSKLVKRSDQRRTAPSADAAPRALEPSPPRPMSSWAQGEMAMMRAADSPANVPDVEPPAVVPTAPPIFESRSAESGDLTAH